MKNRLQFGYLYKKTTVAAALVLIDALANIVFAFQPKRFLPKVVSKILIVKPDHLGDCLLSSSALKALSEKYPDASIDYLAGPWGAPILKEYSRIRKIWSIRHAQHNRGDKGLTKWRLFWRDLRETLPKIRKENYDLILFLRAFGGNFVFTSAFMNGKFLVGHGTGGGGPLLDRVADWVEGKHEVEHFAEVLKLIDIEKSFTEMQPYFERRVHNLPISVPSVYVAIHPGAGAENKKLSKQEWADALKENNLPIVVCGAKDEIGWASNHLSDVTHVVDLAAKLSIRDLFDVFDHASCVQGLDSFAAHLAACSRCPSVTVHFKRYSDPVQWRPLGTAVVVKTHALP